VSRDLTLFFVGSGMAFGLAAVAQAGWKSPTLIKSLFGIAGLFFLASLWGWIWPSLQAFHLLNIATQSPPLDEGFSYIGAVITSTSILGGIGAYRSHWLPYK